MHQKFFQEGTKASRSPSGCIVGQLKVPRKNIYMFHSVSALVSFCLFIWTLHYLFYYLISVKCCFQKPQRQDPSFFPCSFGECSRRSLNKKPNDAVVPQVCCVGPAMFTRKISYLDVSFCLILSITTQIYLFLLPYLFLTLFPKSTRPWWITVFWCSPACSRGHYMRSPIQNTKVSLAYNKRVRRFLPTDPYRCCNINLRFFLSHSRVMRARLWGRPCVKQT